jgi:hypothetical protein
VVNRGCLVNRGGFVGSGSRNVGGWSRGVGSGGRDVGSRGRGVGRLAVGGVGGLTSIDNISHVAAVGVGHLVVDGLEAAVGEGHRVGAAGGVAVTVLTSVDLYAVVVVHGVVVGVDGRGIVGGLLVGGRGVGSRGGDVGSGGRGVAVARGVVSSSQGSQGQDNEDLLIANIKM